jgi:CheY-like chemotaxis protein
MKNHDGDIFCTSEIGNGTTFRLLFPAIERAVITKPAVQPEVQRLRGETILYVDDEEPLVFLMTRLLQRHGYKVVGQTDAAEALRLFRSNPVAFAAVVTDLSMPRISGFDLSSQLLAVRPDLPIVMISGYVRAEDQERARRIGIRDLVLKPDSIDRLGDTLDHLLHRELCSS